jgi:carbonic anhydrase/acetyltransferase-like protein (isoleucine patch superfamily)
MAVRRLSNWFVHAFRKVPIRLSLLAIRPIARLNHRVYMAALIPLLRAAGMKLLGKPRFISPYTFIDGFDDFSKITLGDRVVLSTNVSLLVHDYSITTALIAADELEGPDVAVIRPITIGNNVFVGWGALLMPGTTIGDNVIIGAGSVVRGNVESGTVVAGNPAQKICTIEELLDKHRSRGDALDIRQDRK